MAQRETALYMQTYDLDEHIANIRSIYKTRRDVMLDSIEKYFPKDVIFTRPKGGLFTWVELREDLDAAIILKDALEEKVAYVPGSSFYANGDRANHFRLNYSCMNENLTLEGIKRLGSVLKKHY
jgi:2-aminoadipate transaminase